MNEWYGIGLIILFCIVINIPFGMWRSTKRKLSAYWLTAIHAPVPLVIIIRVLLNIKLVYIPIFIVASIIGQFIGGKIQKGLTVEKDKILEE